MINASFDAMDTPGKKRKRENFQKFVSSTPIKMNNNNNNNNNHNNKENFHFSESCMEVKSIAEIVAERKALQIPATEYEVIRKPPKKKKKAVVEECCFVNPGLDLKVDEKVINPFEVVRDDDTEAKLLAMGVSNPALDIKNEQPLKASTEVSTNPFEVKRDEDEAPKNVCGIENSALDLNNPVRTALVLPLPFTPTVNHRIDFSSMPEHLTPSSLLSTKLVLDENNEAKITPIGTPKKNTTVTIAGRSLSVISEEEIDIGEELDNYQLQLENSINEAKIQNKQYEFDNKSQADAEEVSQQINSETFTKEILKTVDEATKNIASLSGLKESDVDDENYYNDDINDDVQFEEVDSFEDVGKLGQFKRAYRTDAPASIEFKKPTLEPVKKSSKLGGSIRRSIRKLMHPKSKDENEKSSENTEPKHEGIFQTIRHSLRRKQKPKEEVVVSLETTMVGRQVFKETSNNEPKRTLEKATLKRNLVKSVKTFMESVEEFDHF
ncbi:unnamed protein product [Chironomus riparius]|uniref:Uncharacterized protein n=1 Tax=Chironomus riparius TaxID=315576 RepID=A0A9N9RZ19_9DIPT|nr:unnamed protein product [Chironomus riparius]